jgi:hypothetical protein
MEWLARYVSMLQIESEDQCWRKGEYWRESDFRDIMTGHFYETLSRETLSRDIIMRHYQETLLRDMNVVLIFFRNL